MDSTQIKRGSISEMAGDTHHHTLSSAWPSFSALFRGKVLPQICSRAFWLSVRALVKHWAPGDRTVILWAVPGLSPGVSGSRVVMPRSILNYSQGKRLWNESLPYSQK